MADNINQSITDLTTQIKALIVAQEACCQSGSSDVPSQGETVSPPIGPDEAYPDTESYLDSRCNTANWIYDAVHSKVAWLHDNNADLLAAGGSGLAAGIIMAQLLSGPPGWVLTLSEAVVVGLAAFVVQYAIDFEDLEDALDDAHEDCVIGLYNGGSAVSARANFLTALSGATPPITGVEATLVERFLLPNDVVNKLFQAGSDADSYTSSNPIECGSALQTWTFAASGQSWVFRDDSNDGYEASGAWNSGQEAWRITVTGPGTGTGYRGRGTIYLDSLSIAVDTSNSVQLDYSATSDAVSMAIHIKVIFSDATSQEQQFSAGGVAGTAILSIAASKTISQIEVGTSRSWQQSFTVYRDLLEVRVQ